MHTKRMTISGLLALALAGLLLVASLAAVKPPAANAALWTSTMRYGGETGCWGLPGARVVVTSDAGEVHATSAVSGFYRLRFNHVPRGGIGATARVDCVLFGDHVRRVWLPRPLLRTYAALDI